MRPRLGILAALTVLALAPRSFAGHHLWDTTEIFSNASGTVQFIEIFTADDNEQGIGPFSITSGANTFNFVTNCPTSMTANHWVLVATSNFAALPGAVTPDYILPSNFFATGGGTINYAGGVDVWNYGAVPTDGVHSLLRNGSTAVNSPTNFAGQSGSVDLSVVVPALPTWGLVVMVGAFLVAASGLLRKRAAPSA